MKVESNKPNEVIIDKNYKEQERLQTDPQVLSTSQSKDDIASLRNTNKISNADNNLPSKDDLIASLNHKETQITSLSHDQEKYQADLQSLLQKLNDIINSSGPFITSTKNPSQQKQLEHLQALRMLRIKETQKAKNQNKIYKDQYDLIQSKANGNSTEKIGELESRIETLREDNTALNKKVRELKNKQNVKNKVLEGYSANVKYPREIKSHTEEIKALSAKKHDYHMKLINNKKAVNNCVFQMTKIEELYAKLKTMTNLPNPLPIGKIDYEINKIKNDLRGNEDDIIQRIDNEEMVMIQEELRKQQLNAMQGQGQISGNHPKYLKPIILNKHRQNPHTSHSATRKIIVPNVIKALSPKGLKNHLQPMTSNKPRYSNNPSLRSNPISSYNTNNEPLDNNNLDDKDISKITYEQLTDFEYRELLTKKEHYYDINLKLENSIREAKKMYERKLKEMNNNIEENNKKLSHIEQENELLKSEIADLSKITRYNEEENMIKREAVVKELPHQSIGIPTTQKEPHLSNNDVSETRNDILNELNILNEGDKINNTKFPTHLDEEDDVNNIHREGGSKMKFPDLSNVDVIEDDKTIERRNNALSDIKKRYIKPKPKEEIEDEPYLDNSHSDVKDMEEGEIMSSSKHEDEIDVMKEIENIEKKVEGMPLINNQQEEEAPEKNDENEEEAINDQPLVNNDDKIEEKQTKEINDDNTNKSIENKEEDIVKENPIPEGKTIVYVNQREGKHNAYWDEDISPITVIKQNNTPDNNADQQNIINEDNKSNDIKSEEGKDIKEKNDKQDKQEEEVVDDAKNKDNSVMEEEEQLPEKEVENEEKQPERKMNIIEEKDFAEIDYAKQEEIYRQQERLNDSNEEIDLNKEKEEEEEQQKLENSINEKEQKEAEEIVKETKVIGDQGNVNDANDSLDEKDDNNNKEEETHTQLNEDQNDNDNDNDNNNKEEENQQEEEQDNENKQEDNQEEEEDHKDNEDQAEGEDQGEDEDQEEREDHKEGDDQGEEEGNDQEENEENNESNIQKSLVQSKDQLNQINPNEPNPLADSLDKSPEKEANTISTKLKKEDSQNSVFNFPK